MLANLAKALVSLNGVLVGIKLIVEIFQGNGNTGWGLTQLPFPQLVQAVS
jgi:hypothetical protein